MAVIHCRDVLRYPEVMQIISEPYCCYSWSQPTVCRWLHWTSGSYQPHGRSSDTDINLLQNAPLCCRWTNCEGQNKDRVLDLLSVFGVNLGLSLCPNSPPNCRFWGGGCGHPWFHRGCLCSPARRLQQGEGLAVCHPGSVTSGRCLFPAETVQNGGCFQHPPLGGGCGVGEPLWITNAIKKVRTGSSSSSRDRLIPLYTVFIIH